MAENKRYTVKGTDDFFLHIEDTTFTEDAHEGSIYDIYQVVRRLNEQEKEIQRLEKELKRCREWINSDKNDYELTLAFIKNKGFSLQDVLNYEKTLRKENKQLMVDIFDQSEEENLSNEIPTKYYEVWFYQENGFASTSYRVKSFLKKENAKACAKKMNKKNDGIYEVYEKKFADGGIE